VAGLAGLGHVLLAEIRSVVYRRSLPLANRQPADRHVRTRSRGPVLSVLRWLASGLAFGSQERLMSETGELLRLSGVVKSFPRRTRRLDGVDLERHGRQGALPARPERRRQSRR